MNEWDDRRKRDRSDLKEEVEYIHNKLRSLSSALESHSIGSKEVEQTVKNITKGFENTIDSHRNDLNRIGNKQSDIERSLISVIESRKILLSSIAGFALIMSGVAYDYFTHRDEIIKRLKDLEDKTVKIETFIKDWN